MIKEHAEVASSQAPRAPAVTREQKWGEWSQQETTDFLPDVIEHFLLSLRAQQTRKAYARNIKEFLDFCKDDVNFLPTSLSQITEKLLLLWQEYLERKHQRNKRINGHFQKGRVVTTTVARKLSAVSSLLEFALKRNIIQKNPAKLLTRPRIKRQSRTNALSVEEAQKLLNHCKQCYLEAQTSAEMLPRTKASLHLRYAVLHTLFTVGMRVDELCELRMRDVERGVTAQGMARIHLVTKGGEAHSPIVSSETIAVIDCYIAAFRHGAQAEDYLFLRVQKQEKMQKLTQVAVYMMIVKAAQESGLAKHITPHSARATVATLLHRSGVPLGHIQDLLNHKQVQTTALYIKKSDDEVDAAALKLPYLK